MRTERPDPVEETDQPDKEVSTPEPGSAKPSFGKRVLKLLTEGTLILVGAVVISILLRTFVAQMFVIPSGSMENTLQVGDRVLVAKFGRFERGDVVVFEDPSNWLNTPPRESSTLREALEFIGVLPNSDTEHLIKRVVGMPGDHVKCCDADDRIEVNGVALSEEAYLFASEGVQVAPANIPFEIVVPHDSLFVLGDHRNASADSRCRLSNVVQGQPPGMDAFVPVDRVVGASVAIVAPLNRLSTFHLPQTYRDVPAPASPAPEAPELIEVNPGC